MPLSELKEITKKCKKCFGFVDFRHIFVTMGYVHAFSNKWYITANCMLSVFNGIETQKLKQNEE
jgi:hypothetical protein